MPKKNITTYKLMAEDYNCCLFPVFMVWRASGGKTFNKVVGKRMKYGFFDFKDNNWRFGGLVEEWEEVGGHILKRIIQEKEKFFEPFKRNLLLLCDKLIEASIKINKSILPGKSNKQLWKMYSEWMDVWEQMYAYGVVFVFLDFDVPHVSNYLKKYLSNKIESQEEIDRAFIDLTTPSEASFNQQEEASLLKIAAMVRKNYSKLINDFKKKNSDELTALLRKHPKIQSLLKLHARKFGWIGFGWSGPDWKYEDFVVSLADVFKRNVAVEKKLKEMPKEKIYIKIKQKQLFKELKIEKEHEYYFKVAQDILFLKPYRKDILYHSYSLVEPMMQEFSRRLGLSIKQVKFLLPEELKIAFLRGQIDLGILNQRTKHCAYTLEGGERVMIGKELESFLKKIPEEKIDVRVKEIKGSVACSGKARGAVKLIFSADDLPKMEDGDILVSPATNPNLMPAIRKAAAIVTNEGGLTCHAAIVSREFNIPCVIGTGIATKVLKDGDLVEVDATKGIIRKL